MGVNKQARIYANDATGSGEGIQGRAVDNHKGKTMVLKLAVGGELVGYTFEIGIQYWVGNCWRAAANIGKKLLPNSIFLLNGDGARDTVTETGQGGLSRQQARSNCCEQQH